MILLSDNKPKVYIKIVNITIKLDYTLLVKINSNKKIITLRFLYIINNCIKQSFLIKIIL